MELVEYLSLSRIARVVLLLGLGLLAIYAEAAPMGLSATARPSPDLLLCLVAYWALRRPGSTPIVAVFALGLARDLLTDVPVGAGALSLVIMAEVLKAWRLAISRAIFPLEWAVVALAALAVAALQWILVVLTFAQPPYVMSLLHQSLYTAAIYPLIMLTLRWGLRVTWRKREVPA
ncbi:MAG: rod shape-determining protein MreD [Paracoccaceae bacterium]